MPGHMAFYWRRRYASPDGPRILTDTRVTSDPTGAVVAKEIELPEWLVPRQWLAQDPPASVRHYFVIIRVLTPAALGVRMCFHCPDCNAGCDARCERHESCSGYLGNNHKTMGGYAGIATAIAFANLQWLLRMNSKAPGLQSQER